MEISKWWVAAVSMAAMSGAVSAQGLPTHKVLTFDVAQTIAQEALATCRANGYKVTVTVADDNNNTKVLLRDDGAPTLTIEVGRMKNTTALAFGRPSGPPPGLPAGTSPPPPPLPGMIYAKGGVPIEVGDQVIGSVSVSGAPGGDKDEACANAGLAKVADKLK